MSLHNKILLSDLYEILPEGVVASSTWLESKGYSRQLVYKYINSNWLEKLGRGAFMRTGSLLEWQGVVLGLQKLLSDPLHVGGLTALNLQGYAHYLPLAGESKIQLYGSKKLPSWVNSINIGQEFVLNNKSLFSKEVKELGFKQSETKVRDWTLKVSAPERAILEVLYHVENKGISFQHANELFEGLTTLRPKLVNSLLQSCKSDRAVRLFLFLADYNQHAWCKKLKFNGLVGKGKMQIVKSGRFDKRYRITVPESFMMSTDFY